MKRMIRCFIVAVSTWLGAATAQTVITVGPTQLTLPADWDTLSLPIGFPYAMLSYAPGGVDSGMAIAFSNPDSASAAAMGRVFAQALGADGQFIPEGDSSFVSGQGSMSWVQFGVVDTLTGDTARLRYYFASNGSTGLAVMVFPSDPAVAPAMYAGITAMLTSWASTAIFNRFVSRSRAVGNPLQAVDIRGRILRVRTTGPGSAALYILQRPRR